MRKINIVLFLFLPLLLLAEPRLRVVVVVDGLREENMQLMRNYWPEGGLRMMSEEAQQQRIPYRHEIYGGSEAIVSLLTDKTPYEHGIAMDYYFNRSDRKIHAVWEDSEEHGIGTHQKLSPRAILSTTMVDRLKLETSGKAKIYAIGIQPFHTLAMAGHGANACCWFDPESQRWVSTTYYPGGLPASADRMNISGRIEEVMTREWTPRLDIAAYNRPSNEESKKGWKYEMAKYPLTTPGINELAVELALKIQEDEKLGTNPTRTDMLLVELTTETPKTHSDRIETAEQEDMLLRVNQDLGFLIEQLGRRLGKDRLEVTLLGIPNKGVSADQMAIAGIRVRPFNADRAAALTGTYLMALYGHERWVDGSYGHALFLNRSLIDQKKLDIAHIEHQVATFLMEFEGVRMAYTAHEAMMTTGVKESLNKRTAGDVVFQLEDNRQLMRDGKQVLDEVVEPDAEAVVMNWKTINYEL